MRTGSVRFLLLPFLLLAACSDRPATPGRSVVVPRAQPSVFQAISSFDASYERMSDIGLQSGADGKTLVAAEFAAAKAAGEPATLASFAWSRIALAPERYVRMAGKVVSFQVQDRPCCTGTAFAVDSEGTLLTNYHVVAPDLVAADPQALAAFVNEDAAALVRGLLTLVGGPPPGELGDQLDQNLGAWLLAQYRCTGLQLHEVRLATILQPAVQPVRILRIRPAPPLPDWKKSTVACEVLANGEVFPGKDIAVLRASSLKSKLISLPLGDSSRVVGGTKVFALGFPGAAIIEGVDAEAARYRVIAHDGIVDQRLRIEQGWEAFHLTANTNHGDSGGPVIDESGQVIAITVAGNNDAAAQNLAIPIAIAKEFLAQAQVLVLPGRSKLTETWYRACDEFQAQRYAAALPLFEEVNRLQGGWLLGAMSSPGQATEMIEICRAETGRGGEGQAGAAYWWKIVCEVVAKTPLWTKVLIGAFVLAALLWLLKAVAGLLGRLGTGGAAAAASAPAQQVVAPPAEAVEPAPAAKRRAKPRRKRPTA